MRSLHDADLVLWSEQQATALRRLEGTHDNVDWPRLAEHLETVGRMAAAHVEEALRTMLAQSIAGFCDPGGLFRRMRSERVLASASAISGEVGPTIRERIDLDRLWSEAFDMATSEIDAGPLGVPPIPGACPFTLDELLAEDFTYDRAVEQLYIRLTSWRPPHKDEQS